MIKITNKALCCGCNACNEICPKNAISIQKDSMGFVYPATNTEKCINCGLCNSVCPVTKYKNADENLPLPKAYAAAAVNDKQRISSTSGGVFSALAEKIIDAGGVVYGAAFDFEYNLKHICVSTKPELFKLRGSKYLQSDTIGIFFDVKQKLQNGTAVLFSGTPCQIAGLKSYLKKDYDNLLCVDIICHSVPSPLVWSKYKNELCSENGKLTGVNFRSKATGWIDYSYCFEASFGNGKVIRQSPDESAYMQAFINGLSTRPSCDFCAFRKLNRQSDITLGDFWGIQKYYPQYAENSGTSLVLTHTEKGEKAVMAVKTSLRIYETDTMQSLKDNPAAYIQKPVNPLKDSFFENLEKTSLASAVKSILKPSKTEKLKAFAKGLIKH